MGKSTINRGLHTLMPKNDFSHFRASFRHVKKICTMHAVVPCLGVLAHGGFQHFNRSALRPGPTSVI
jgi:hypothetical protein